MLHFGDHDPSGIDMSRDIQDRLRLFGSEARLMRIALTSEQIDRYSPPPDPVKTTDGRVWPADRPQAETPEGDASEAKTGYLEDAAAGRRRP